MTQEQIHKQTPQKKKEEIEPQVQPKVSEGATDALDELDALLDEIDSVLEINAAEFVKNYIQSGGQFCKVQWSYVTKGFQKTKFFLRGINENLRYF